MNPYLRLALLATLPALAAGCTTTGARPPIDVTRYHLSEPFERTTVTVMPMSGAMDVTPEFRAYADAVQAELADGVLTLRIPKPEELKPRRVEIKGGTSQPRELQESAT